MRSFVDRSFLLPVSVSYLFRFDGISSVDSDECETRGEPAVEAEVSVDEFPLDCSEDGCFVLGVTFEPVISRRLNQIGTGKEYRLNNRKE